MKLILIKIGKAFSILKRDGLIRGGKRVLSAFFALFRRVAPGDILFVTGGVGDSALYRAHHVAEELEIHGFKCSITVQDNPWLPGYADKFKIFIFHRVLHTPGVSKFIKKIKSQNKEIIFETDDLVFDPKYVKDMDFYKNMNKLERMLYENGVGGEILKDPDVKVCTTTTTYLAGKLKEYPARNASDSVAGGGKQVFIVPNKLSNKDLETVEKILNSEQRTANNDQKIRIGYFSGTISHNKDFAIVVDALMQIMEKHPQVKLLLAGPLDIGNKFNEFKDRIERFPYIRRSKYFENVAKVDIAIAPLETGNPFCESKSELKFFEPGILGIPVVAVANQTFSEAITDGVNGFLAADTGEWAEKLDKLITDGNLRREIGQKAREKALRDYTNKNSHNEEYYDYLKQVLSRNY